MYNDCSVYSYIGKNKCIQFNQLSIHVATDWPIPWALNFAIIKWNACIGQNQIKLYPLSTFQSQFEKSFLGTSIYSSDKIAHFIANFENL